jgi:hypothetical protein
MAALRVRALVESEKQPRLDHLRVVSTPQVP